MIVLQGTHIWPNNAPFGGTLGFLNTYTTPASHWPKEFAEPIKTAPPFRPLQPAGGPLLASLELGPSGKVRVRGASASGHSDWAAVWLWRQDGQTCLGF